MLNPVLKIIISTILILATPFIIKSQYLPNPIWPSSPTSASLAKYGVVPVSNYTGTPNISVPIYTLKTGAIELPISISYHASGIRVNELASNVGLGWSLNAGGVITRQVKGLSDNKPKQHAMDAFEVTAGPYPSAPDFENVLMNFNDSEPDVYTFNFNGYSGQFIMDESFNAFTLSNKNGLEIDYDQSNDIFTIITKEGTKYLFHEQESTYSLVRRLWEDENKVTSITAPNSIVAVTGWRLTEIIGSNNFDRITFEYDDESVVYTTAMEGSKVLGYNGVPPFDVFSEDWINSSQKRLKFISTNIGTEIALIYGQDRKDLDDVIFDPKALSEIIIQNNTEEYHHKFITSYFNASSNSIETADAEDLRLRLDEVHLFDNQDSGPMIYNFSYYGDLSGEENLPNRHIKGNRDSWGFYNGNNSSTIIPKYQGYYTQTVITKSLDQCSFQETQTENEIYIFEAGLDVTPSLEHTVANSLKSIKYPTGGTTTFNFQLHEYSSVNNQDSGINKPAGGLRVHKIINKDTDGSFINELTYSYNKFSSDFLSESALSSGVIFSEPENVSETFIRNEYGTSLVPCGFTQTSITKSYPVVYSSPIYSLYSYGGNHIGYSHVKVTDGNGETIYKYNTGEYLANNSYLQSYFYLSQTSSSPSLHYYQFSTESLYPFHHRFQGDFYKRGTLLNSVIKNNNNQIVNKTENSYLYEPTGEVWGMQPIYEASSNNASYLVSSYYYEPGKSVLYQTKETIYSSNGDNPKESIWLFEYDDNDLITLSTVEKGDGDQILTELYYPYDYSNTTGFIGEMKDKHIISSPIEVIRYIKPSSGSKSIISAEVNVYGTGNNAGRPIEKWILDLTSPLDEANFTISNSTGPFIKFNDYRKDVKYQYDPQSHLIEVAKIDNTSIAYLWGYENSLPIAKVINAANGNDIINQTITNVSSSYHFYKGGGSSIISYDVIDIAYTQDVSISYTYAKEDPNDNTAYDLYFSIITDSQTLNSTTVTIAEDDSDGIINGTLIIYNVPAGLHDFRPVKEYETTIDGDAYFVKNIITETFGRSTEVFYENFEEHFLKVSSSSAHTGNFIYLGTYNLSLEKLLEGDYTLVYWSSSNGSEWVKQETIVSVNSNSTSMNIGGSTTYLDDVMLFPIDAMMTTSTYKPLFGMTSQTDPNGQTTYFTYDDLGRLQTVTDFEGNPLSETEYHYSGQ